MKPSVGRIVHFYDHTRTRSSDPSFHGPYAAIITAVRGDVIDLTYFPPSYPPSSVEGVDSGGPMPEGATGSYWVWPPRE